MATKRPAKKAAKPATQPDASSGTISVDQAAKLLMITPQWLRKIATAGYMPKPERGRINLVAAVQGYIKSLKDEERGKTKSAADNRVRDARAREIEMRLAERTRELIPAEDATGAIDVITGAVREEFSGLPARATRDMELRRKLEAEVNGCFERVAKTIEATCEFVAEGGDLPNAGTADDA